MNASELKLWIYENNKIEELLESIGCHSVKYHAGGYYTAGNFDGSNKTAITIYVPQLNIVNYTRELPTPSDIFTLVEHNKGLNFFQSMKYICELFGLDFYAEPNQDLPYALQILKMLGSMKSGDKYEEDDTPVKPIPESILKYYRTPTVNDMFLKDGISYETQIEFEYGYDDCSNRLTIPIRDETGMLCGIKARLFKEHLSEDDLKYIYLEPCAKSKILYNYHRSYKHIKESNRAFVGESEKFCAQLWSYGYKNCISLGGKKISKVQIDKLIRLNAEIVLCLDKDVDHKELEEIASRFIDGVSVWAMFDREGILGEKESPSDKAEKWEYLVEHCIEKIK
jgi:DNA primase